MAKGNRKINTTEDSGGDRRRPDPDRVNARQRAVTGDTDTGDRSAGREAGPRPPAGDAPAGSADDAAE